MSPLFHRRSEEEKAADQAAAEERREAAQRSDERAARSLELIEAGHIPVAAAERLAQFTEAGGGSTVFSSDLAVSEWSALARIGVTPITQVMGSSIYHVGWQPTYYNVPTEVRVLSDAYNESRRLALGRLLEEAQACRADAVVAVDIIQGAHDWVAGAIEFVAIGTAVRLPEGMRDPARQTVLSDLTGQEFALLCEAGVRPVGIAAHTSVHYVPASGQTQMAQSSFGGAWGGGGGGGSWANQELVDFSQGVYEAREKAMGFVNAQVRELGGDGVIGVEIGEQSRTHAVRRGMYESKDLEVTFHVMGTVVREDPALASQSVQPVPLKILSLS
ncbi:MAG TPA: heavy metal-binding domain-containing protein [Solirubrobacteraceae bacterium]|nr:heavy metal-binding domain-containing protein [Solirubrobacteraceae bacterium]